jgi:hypothetical protein
LEYLQQVEPLSIFPLLTIAGLMSVKKKDDQKQRAIPNGSKGLIKQYEMMDRAVNKNQCMDGERFDEKEEAEEEEQAECWDL